MGTGDDTLAWMTVVIAKRILNVITVSRLV